MRWCRPTLVLTVALAGGCKSEPTAEQYLATHRPAVTAKLARIAQIAAQVEKAPPLTASSTLRDPGTRLHVCLYDRSGPFNKAGEIKTPLGNCNTRVIRLGWLVDWHKQRDLERGSLEDSNTWAVNQPFNSIDWFVETASLIESGQLATAPKWEAGPEGKVPYKRRPSLWNVQHPLGQLADVRFVLVVRGHGSPYDVFLYDVEGPTALGGFRLAGRGEITTYVFATGPNAGKFARSTDSTTTVLRSNLNAELLQRLSDVVLYPPF